MILTEFERKKLRQLVAVALGDDTRFRLKLSREQSPCMISDIERDIECWLGLLPKLADPPKAEPEIPPLIRLAEYGAEHATRNVDTYARAEFLPEELAEMGITQEEYNASRNTKKLKCVHGRLFAERCEACEKSVGDI